MKPERKVEWNDCELILMDCRRFETNSSREMGMRFEMWDPPKGMQEKVKKTSTRAIHFPILRLENIVG